MSNFRKFPKIGQFNQVIRNVRSQCNYQGQDGDDAPIYLHNKPYPKSKVQGTIKLHGTNAAIGFDKDKLIWTQSRNRMLTTVPHSGNDNQGFAHFVATRSSGVIRALKLRNVLIFGEWCGGSIQASVALNKLPNMFVIFAVKDLDSEEWITEQFFGIVADDLELLNKESIYLISQFPMYEIEIDFNHPELVQNQLVELTKAVGDECPVAKTLGVEGTGEGIVWKLTEPGFESSAFWFKVKDERHQASKVKTLAPIDIEKVKSIEEFVNKTVTGNRLNQGIEYLKEMDTPIVMKSTGDFLKWVFNDILDEDGDTLTESGLTRKDVGSAISRRAKEFWVVKVNEAVGL